MLRKKERNLLICWKREINKERKTRYFEKEKRKEWRKKYIKILKKKERSYRERKK